jgi:hypothetical protein
MSNINGAAHTRPCLSVMKRRVGVRPSAGDAIPSCRPTGREALSQLHDFDLDLHGAEGSA